MSGGLHGSFADAAANSVCDKLVCFCDFLHNQQHHQLSAHKAYEQNTHRSHILACFLASVVVVEISKLASPCVGVSARCQI